MSALIGRVMAYYYSVPAQASRRGAVATGDKTVMRWSDESTLQWSDGSSVTWST